VRKDQYPSVTAHTLDGLDFAMDCYQVEKDFFCCFILHEESRKPGLCAQLKPNVYVTLAEQPHHSVSVCAAIKSTSNRPHVVSLVRINGMVAGPVTGFAACALPISHSVDWSHGQTVLAVLLRNLDQGALVNCRRGGLLLRRGRFSFENLFQIHGLLTFLYSFLLWKLDSKLCVRRGQDRPGLAAIFADESAYRAAVVSPVCCV
jgi:hypothetical protein